MSRAEGPRSGASRAEGRRSGGASAGGHAPLLWITVGAVALRLLLFLGRGSYVAFDEGWYLLLGRNLWSGEGYTLSGLQHVALSPLFPVVAGAAGRVIHDAVWGGRIVAAISSGLVVLPCWYIFGRLGGRRLAILGTTLVALLPSLAPFVVPFWIDWDLWVGAEPLLHLLLYTAIALFLRAWERRSVGDAVVCGGAFALAYLARPEAIVTFGLLAAVASGFSLAGGAWLAGRRSDGAPAGPRRSAGRSRPVQFAACALAFLVVSLPYWMYLHDTLGRWTVTGRWVQVAPSSATSDRTSSVSSNRIEDMLWRGDASAYIRSLYSLTPGGTALANGYWGVPAGAVGRAGDANGSVDVPEPDRDEPSVVSGAGPEPATDAVGQTSAPSSAEGADATETRPWLLRFAEALGVAVPWYLWLLVIPGVAAPGKERRLDLEALVGVPLVATGILIARVVAIDPRTQLFIAPLAAMYAARGLLVVADAIKSRLGERIRGDIVTGLLVGAVVLDLLGTSAVRLVMSLTVGSPHHVVAAQNAAVGAAIAEATSEDATVMSFHPALALFADRDWRVLPLEPLDRIVRYARTQPDPYLVLSVFYPPEVRPLEEPHYLIVPVPADLPDSDRWRIDIPEVRTVMAFGELAPVE